MRKSSSCSLIERQFSNNLNPDFDKYKRDYSDLKREVSTLTRLLSVGSNGKDSQKELISNIETDLDVIIKHSNVIYNFAPKYDFKNIKANGYRSFLMIANKCCVILLNHIRSINSRNKVYYWSKSQLEDITNYSLILHELSRCFYFLEKMIDLTKDLPAGNDGKLSLFPPKDLLNHPEVVELIRQSDFLRQDIFYGKCLGFYYCNSAKKIFEVLSSVLGGYAHSYVTNKSGFLGIFNTVFQTMNCYVNPENRGQLMASITRQATVEFTKLFWNLGENPLVLEAPNIILPPVEIAFNFTLPCQPFHIKITDPVTKSTSSLLVQPPTYRKYTNDKVKPSIKLRLLSFRFREGMSWLLHTTSYTPSDVASSNLQRSRSHSTATSPATQLPSSAINSPNVHTVVSSPALQTRVSNSGKRSSKEASNNLLIHCHGGGFVAQSAKAHDIYLRSWAERLDCPILSIDYSLAPEQPFPVALHECHYAIVWAMRNKKHLGCKPDARVIFCGDSAGANLILCATLMCINDGVPLPHGLMLSYVPSLVTMTPSPARLMSSLDPLLPMGVLARCLLAYVGIDESKFLSQSTTKSTESNVNPPPMQYLRTLSKTVSSDKLNYVQEDLFNSPLLALRSASIPLNPLMSPLIADPKILSKLPPVTIVGTHLDPLLDDCVELCKQLDQSGVPVTFDVLHDIPHGFLNFVLLSRECELGSQRCVSHLQRMFATPPHNTVDPKPDKSLHSNVIAAVS